MLLLFIVLLSIQEGVGEKKFLGIHLVILPPNLFSVEGLRPKPKLGELVLQPHQLVEEVGTDLEVRSPEMHELQCLVESSTESIQR